MTAPFMHLFGPHDARPDHVILPRQAHGIHCVEIVSGEEDLTACDGIWTRRRDLLLGVRTADCAPVAIWDDERIGMVHVGWRGLVDGIIGLMLKKFNKPRAWVGPLYPVFEIKRDRCYDAIKRKLGDAFLEEQGAVMRFRFRDAVLAALPDAACDPRSTYETPALASWRRDRTDERNVMVIGYGQL